MNACNIILVPVCLLFAGALVDRWHPVRVNAYLSCNGAFIALGGWVWLFLDKPPPMLYFYLAIMCGVFSCVLGAMGSIIEIPRLIKLFPCDRFGQFSGAIAICRGPAVIPGGFLAGLFLDFLKHVYPHNMYAYRFNFLWSGPLAILAFYFNYRVYRAWKRLGGDKPFTPPLAPFRLEDLPPRADDPGRVPRGLVGLISLAYGGGFLAGLIWCGYYFCRLHDLYGARILLIAQIAGLITFLALLRFLKFMERA